MDARLSERINGLDARLELIQWSMAIFIAPLMIPLLIYFAKRAWDEASFQFLVKRDELSRAVPGVGSSGGCFEQSEKTTIDKK